MASSTNNGNGEQPGPQTSKAQPSSQPRPANQKQQQQQQQQPREFRLMRATRADLAECTRVELSAMLATSELARALYPDGMTEAAVEQQTAAKMRKFDIDEVTYIKGVLATANDDGKKGEEVMIGYLRAYTWATDEAARFQPPYGEGDNKDEKKAPPPLQAEKKKGVLREDDDGVVTAQGPKGESLPKDRLTERQRIEVIQREVHDGLRRKHVSGKKAVYVSALMVRPEYHGKGGYGRQLLSHAIDMAREAGHLPVYLMGQPTALGFYKKMGFSVVETAVVDFGGLCGMVGEHKPSLMMFDTAAAAGDEGGKGGK